MPGLVTYGYILLLYVSESLLKRHDYSSFVLWKTY